MRTVFAAFVVLVLAACSDAVTPAIGEPYFLRTVNGQPLPWSTPTSDSTYLPMTITEGWITILNDSLAERHERYERLVLAPNGIDWLPIIAEFTNVASYERGLTTIVLTYLPSGGAVGPPQPAETLQVTRRGALVLRQMVGYLPPLDSIVRVYCKAPSC
jgi:hypothetical protein